ncbi:MAG TPA: pirin [Planctomycetes bacterium]|nr:pirin [Planctomycetota bacterium]
MAILSRTPLGAPPWPTRDPFLFCVHHRDDYPAGNEALGLDPEQLRGRSLGMDFSGREGWSMYHGEEVPGFPRHPHRGFETVTLARRGFVDHSDSLGAAARFGKGDAQWMTAGRGIVHSEMFPLIERSRANPCELFQIWLNLPARDKRVEPHFSMLWAERLPVVRRAGVEVLLVAGERFGVTPPAPPPSSWAAEPANQVAIATIRLEAGGGLTLPALDPGVGRSLYVFAGEVALAGEVVRGERVEARAEVELELEGRSEAEVLLLEGRPIGEPVAQHGPFVMNRRVELLEAMRDYQRDGFGGWPWESDAPVHPRERGRWARHADGREESPATS